MSMVDDYEAERAILEAPLVGVTEKYMFKLRSAQKQAQETITWIWKHCPALTKNRGIIGKLMQQSLFSMLKSKEKDEERKV